MKKFLVIVLVLSMIFTMVGCGKENEEKKEDTKVGKKVTLTVAARGGSHADVIEAVKGKFETTNNCSVEVLGLEAADLKQKAALDATNKEGAYDLVMIDDPVMPEFIKGEVLLNLSSEGYEKDDDFVEASAALGRGPYATGDTYALPFTGNVQLLFYNQEVLNILEKEVPTSWEEVLNIAKTSKEQGVIGYVIRGQQGNPIVTDYLPLLWAYGGQVFDEDWNVMVDSKEAKEALAMYVELLKVGANYEKDDIIGAVSEGNATMGLGWPSWFISSDGAKAAYARIPSKAKNDSVEYSTGMIGNWMMGVTANTKNKELSIKLLEYLTSADVQKEAVMYGGVPTRVSVFTDDEVIEVYPYFTTIFDGTVHSVKRPRTPKWSNVEEVYGKELSNVVAGVKDIDTALSDAKKAIEKVMK